MTTRSLASLTLLLSLILSLVPGSASAAFQAREHLIPEEIELVKDAQILDKRIEVFIKAADRRMLVLTGSAAPTSKQMKKDSETWGSLPTGTRAELIGDIAGIFSEAIVNIDDVNARDEKNPLIPKALRNLAERTGVDDLKKLVAVLIQADRFGTGVAQSLRLHSDFMRVQTRQIAEEKAAKLGVKLIFPIFFCILPSLFVVTVGPVIMKIVRELIPMMNNI